MTLDDKPKGVNPKVPNTRRVTPRRTTPQEIERYSNLFAERTRQMKSSAMRDLMSVIARPEVISLAGGLPDTATFPADVLESVLSTVAHEQSAAMLQYGPTEGAPAMGECIQAVMAAEGMVVSTDEIIVTTGGQQVIDLVTRALIDPGDTIVAEAPTYPGAVPSFSGFQANVVQIDVDSDGMQMDALEETLDVLEASGRRPKFIYTIPTFQNPSGVTMSLARRKRLIQIARERELLVLEDNPYALLRYSGEPLPTLRSLDGGDYVMYLGTFSKILAPGMRIGWLVAPAPILAKVNLAKQAADLCTSSVTQFIAVEYFKQNDWRTYVHSVTDVYRSRRDAMLAALERYFPTEAEWTRPEGGLFIWATLPEYIDTDNLLADALRADVAFVPGSAAYMDGRGGSSMRLNFSSVDEAHITEGIRRIGELISEHIALYGTMTGKPATRSAAAASEPGPTAEVLRLPTRLTRQKKTREK